MEIYLDHLASTPMDPEVLAAMMPWFAGDAVGNPHSAGHRAGWRAAAAVDRARADIARLIGATAGEIVFTSGATEANNLAMLGAVPPGCRVIVSAIEHASVFHCLPALVERGHAIALLPVDGRGFVDRDRLEVLLAQGPAFVSIMSANNEIGTIQDLDAISALCRRHGAILHVDGAQSLSTVAIDVAASGIDLLSLSGHKLYGPMGVGALYIRDGLAIAPVVLGGGQQAGRRSGTVPVALAVGLAKACAGALAGRGADACRLTALRERLYDGLMATIHWLRRNSPAEHCLPGCLNITIPGVDSADLLLDLPDVALSTGSACGQGAPSHVLKAIGRSDEEIHGSLRFGIGRSNTVAEIDAAVAALSGAVSRWRDAAPRRAA